jgi:hypothetical protein
MGRTSRLEAQVRAWAEQHGCSLRALNEGHHWLFQRPAFMAEWWPSSARLAVNRDYGNHIHAPHWGDVVTALEQHLAMPRPSQPGLSPNAGQVPAGLFYET